MRTHKVDPENVDQRLFEIFRRLGYDGTSMELLSQSTGLKKASLYHRFPKGKQEMAEHVLKNVEQWIEDNIAAVLANKAILPHNRIKKALNALDELYNGGTNNCLLRTLSVGIDADIFRKGITRCFTLITQSFTTIGIELGLSKSEAEKKASLINPLLQGALVLSGATGNNSYFKNCLNDIQVLFKASN